MMDELAEVILLALVVEAVWETLKMTWEDGKFSVDKVGVLLLALITVVVYGIDLLAIAEITMNTNFLGVILSGVLISRGSTFVHELIKKIGG